MLAEVEVTQAGVASFWGLACWGMVRGIYCGMSFLPEFLDEIRLRVLLSDSIARRVPLTRKGREFAGLCPFHKEKTPSFTVNDEKGFFHCFGCGAHGDVIGFEMRMDGISFPEAVERLAGVAGLALPKQSPEDRRSEEHTSELQFTP